MARRVVVIGAGSAGEHFVGALRRHDADAEIVIVERALAGGECSYYACLPTKTLLRPVEALAAARLAPGAAEAVTGDIDGDGNDDFIVGAPDRDLSVDEPDAGGVYLVLESAPAQVSRVRIGPSWFCSRSS